VWRSTRTLGTCPDSPRRSSGRRPLLKSMEASPVQGSADLRALPLIRARSFTPSGCGLTTVDVGLEMVSGATSGGSIRFWIPRKWEWHSGPAPAMSMVVTVTIGGGGIPSRAARSGFGGSAGSPAPAVQRQVTRQLPNFRIREGKEITATDGASDPCRVTKRVLHAGRLLRPYICEFFTVGRGHA
jgi:hypothetical protein